ncbi:MAG TPA: hypothetical protein VFE53_04115 [Mucilaginibacter sp.]|nr:hypothetical protein [Mucilaginibacter sp.]
MSVFIGYRGWLTNRSFTKFDGIARSVTETFANIQLVIGVWLYFISPIVAYFFSNFKEAVHQREIRFFGMEHVTMMLAAMIVIILGSVKSSRKQTPKAKFKTMAIWFSIALFLIFTSIPWQFSPLVSRPYFRPF